VYLAMNVWCAVVSVFWLRREIVFDVTYKLRIQYNMGRRNRNLKVRDNGQMTPCGYSNFISYVKNLGFLYSSQTDRQTETLIWCGLGNLE
jgi:hypothetical protein